MSAPPSSAASRGAVTPAASHPLRRPFVTSQALGKTLWVSLDQFQALFASGTFFCCPTRRNGRFPHARLEIDAIVARPHTGWGEPAGLCGCPRPTLALFGAYLAMQTMEGGHFMSMLLRTLSYLDREGSAGILRSQWGGCGADTTPARQRWPGDCVAGAPPGANRRVQERQR